MSKHYTENTLRRRARRVGYYLHKGFQHFGQTVLRDKDGNRLTGYMLSDMRTMLVIWGYDGLDNRLDLEDVEDILKDTYKLMDIPW